MPQAREACYDDRLSAVRRVARRFPGLIDVAGHEHRGLGLWAGIFLQTKWQKESGRGRLRIWNLVNADLTIAPHRYHLEYLRDRRLPPASDPAYAWKDFFSCHDAASRLKASPRRFERMRGTLLMRFRVPRKFWRAHNASIAGAVRRHLDEFSSSSLPREELAFWNGWIRLLVWSEAISPPTTDLVLMPFLNAVMPPRSPLGEGDRISDQPFLRRAFLNAVASLGN